MRARRSLTLRREELTELATNDLSHVVGAADRLPTTPVSDCLLRTARCTQTEMPACAP